MANLGDLKFGVKVDKNSLNTATLDIKKQMQNTGNEIEKNLGQGVKGGVDEAKRQISSLTDLFKIAGKAFLAIFAINKIIDLGKGIMSLASNLQQNEISFTSMLGSADKAKKLLTELSDFAKKTPFELVGIRENAKQLIAMGVAEQNILPTLKALGDVSAGLSVPLDRLALAYGQVISKGRLMGDDLRQFTEAGVPMIETLSKMLGKTTGEISKMVENGQIGAKEVTQAFMIMSSEGGRFANLMEKQSGTMQGLWSNLTDSLTQLGEKIGTKVVPQISNAINAILDFVNRNGEAIANYISEFISGIGDVFNFLKTLGYTVVEAYDLVSGAIKKAGEWLGVFGTQTSDTDKLIELSKGTVYDYRNAIEDLARTQYAPNTEGYIRERNEIVKNIQASIQLLKARQSLGVIALKEAQKSKPLTGGGSLSPLKTGGLQPKIDLKLPAGFGNSIDANKQLLDKFNNNVSGFINDPLQKQIKEQEDALKNIDKMVDDIRKKPAGIDLGLISNSGGGGTKKTAGKSAGEKLAEEVQKVAVDKLKTSYSELQKRKEDLAKAEEEYKNASIKFNEEIQDSIRKIGKELEANQKKYDEQVKQINLDAKNQNKSTTEDFLRSQVEKQVELENEGKQIQKNIDLARQEGRYDDTIQLLKDQEANAAKLKDVKENIANVTKSEGIDVQKILDVERQRAALTDEKKDAFDFNAKLAQTEADRKQKEEQAKKDFEAEKLKLQRQQEIYEFFQSKKQLGVVELENFQKTEKFKNMSQEEQDLVLKLAKEKFELQQKRDDRIRAEQEVADATTDLSNKTTEVLKTNVSKLSLEYKNLVAEIKNALEAQKQLNVAASKARTGFAEGGYTGDGGVNDVAGVVHKGEFVVPNSMLNRIPGLLPALEAQRVGNYDYSRKVEISGPINMNQAVDFELLLEKAKFRM